MVECLLRNYMVVGSSPIAVTYTSDFAPVSGKEFLDIQATTECGFTLKRVRDMIKTFSQFFISIFKGFMYFLRTLVSGNSSQWLIL